MFLRPRCQPTTQPHQQAGCPFYSSPTLDFRQTPEQTQTHYNRRDKEVRQVNYPDLIAAISQAHDQARQHAAGAVNRQLILRNWLIGAYLVEFEQNGQDRANYGTGLLKRVARDLAQHAVSGCSSQMLERMRLFFRRYPQMASAISSPLVSESHNPLPTSALEISAPPVRKSGSPTVAPTPLPTQILLRLS